MMRLISGIIDIKEFFVQFIDEYLSIEFVQENIPEKSKNDLIEKVNCANYDIVELYDFSDYVASNLIKLIRHDDEYIEENLKQIMHDLIDRETVVDFPDDYNMYNAHF